MLILVVYAELMPLTRSEGDVVDGVRQLQDRVIFGQVKGGTCAGIDIMPSRGYTQKSQFKLRGVAQPLPPATRKILAVHLIA